MLAKGGLAGTGRSGGGAQYVRLLDLASVIGEERERGRRRLRINLAST